MAIFDFLIDWINLMLSQLEGGYFGAVVPIIKLILAVLVIWVFYDKLERKRKMLTKLVKWLSKQIDKLRH